MPPSRQQQSGGAPETSRSTLADRDAFRARLQQHFNERDVAGTPFMLLALRMGRAPGQQGNPFDFESVLDFAQGALRPKDDLLVDYERERIIVLLASSDESEAQRFFSRLKRSLRQEMPERADELLQSVAAIEVPNGQPFPSAEEFLTYALDEE
jgi:GGDEF domain-containing protein